MGSSIATAGLLLRRASGGAGSSTGEVSNSASGLLSTLIPTLIPVTIFVILFLIFRTKFKRIYQPRTYVGAFAAHQKTPETSNSRFGWISPFMKMPDSYVLNHHSLDGYFYLRFFRTLILICGLGMILTWAVLMPVYGTSHAGKKQFDKIAYTNIDSTVDAYRVYATVFVAWVFLGFIMIVVGRESIYAVQLQQAFHLLPGMASRISARTVLFSNVPKEYLNMDRLTQTFPTMKHAWIATDTEKLEELIEDRDKVALKLEAAEIKLSMDANKKRLKAMKKGGTGGRDAENQSQYLDDKARPTHRLGKIPLIGKKVDTINWSRSHLGELLPKIKTEQESNYQGNSKFSSAVFVEFHSVQAAEAAFHQTHSKLPKGFAARAIGARPHEVIWKNLNMSLGKHKIMTAVATAIIFLMIIFWIPITAFIGALANINNLITTAPFLSFINKLPTVLLGLITGLLPTIIMAVCLALVPIIMRLLFKKAGAVTTPEVELRTQTWYFVFQFIQVFLVTTLASGAISAYAPIAKNPSMAATLLASSIPKASNFYIDYFVFYGLTAASGALLNIVALILYIVLGKLLDKTPRKMFKRYTTIPSLGWGSVFPVFINLGVIAIIYSCIAPLILGFATISFFLVYVAFRYNMFYTQDVLQINTQGRCYRKALQQLTTGVYVSEVCLIGLFAISTAGNTQAAGPLGLMVGFLVITALYHIFLNMTLKKIEKNIAFDEQSSAVHSNGKDELNAPLNGEGHTEARMPSNHAGKTQGGILVKLLHPPALPAFDPFLSTPLPEYADVARNEAYIAPAIRNPTPVVWIVKDEMGISTREKAKTSEIIPCTDDEAWFDAKGKVTTSWVGEEARGEKDVVKRAPIYDEPIHY